MRNRRKFTGDTALLMNTIIVVSTILVVIGALTAILPLVAEAAMAVV